MTRTIRAFAAGLALWSLPVAAQAGAPASKARGAEKSGMSKPEAKAIGPRMNTNRHE